MRTMLATAVLSLAVSSAHSAGFRLTEQDAAANGMGNAFVAVANNASAVWYNPAAMTDLEGTNMSLGTVMVYPGMKHDYTGGSDEIAKKLHIPPSVYLTRKMGDSFALGFSFNAPFGLSTEWETTSRTKYIATLSDIKALNYGANAAAKLGERLSLAFGLNYIALDATLNKMAHPSYPTWELEMEGDGHGMGWNTALFYRLGEKSHFGASYRSPVKIDVDGTAKVDAYNHLSNPATTKITLPDNLQFGFAFQTGEKWLISLSADYTDWATYHRLVIRSNTILTLTGSDTYYDTKNWRSVWGFHAGAENKVSDSLKLRYGFFYDANPVKEKYYETRVPDSDRVAGSIGAGWAVSKNLTLDVSYTYLMFLEREVKDSTKDNATANPAALNGKYKSAAHLPGIGLSYKF